MCVCEWMDHVWEPMEAKGASASLELQFQKVVRHHVGDENQALALCKSTKRS